MPGKSRLRLSSATLIATAVILAPLALLVLPTTLMLMLGLVPTAVAYIVDRNPDKTSAMTVGGMNLAGIMPFLIDLWRGGHSSELAISLLLEPLTWLVMYGGAAVGWGIYHIVPPLVGSLANARDQARIRELDQQRGRLMEEWGMVVAGRAALMEGKAPEEGGDADGAPEDTAASVDGEAPAKDGDPGTR